MGPSRILKGLQLGPLLYIFLPKQQSERWIDPHTSLNSWMARWSDFSPPVHVWVYNGLGASSVPIALILPGPWGKYRQGLRTQRMCLCPLKGWGGSFIAVSRNKCGRNWEHGDRSHCVQRIKEVLWQSPQRLPLWKRCAKESEKKQPEN